MTLWEVAMLEVAMLAVMAMGQQTMPPGQHLTRHHQGQLDLRPVQDQVLPASFVWKVSPATQFFCLVHTDHSIIIVLFALWQPLTSTAPFVDMRQARPGKNCWNLVAVFHFAESCGLKLPFIDIVVAWPGPVLPRARQVQVIPDEGDGPVPAVAPEVAPEPGEPAPAPPGPGPDNAPGPVE